MKQTKKTLASNQFIMATFLRPQQVGQEVADLKKGKY